MSDWDASDNDEEWEVPTFNVDGLAEEDATAKTFSDEEEEEEVAEDKPEVAAPAVAQPRPAGSGKSKKNNTQAMLREREEKDRLAAEEAAIKQRAVEAAAAEGGAAGRKAALQALVEEGDRQLAEDLFATEGGGEGAQPGPPPMGAEEALSAVPLVLQQDYLDLGSLLASRLVDAGSHLNTLAFLKHIIKEVQEELSTADLADITAAINVIKNAKVKASKGKGAKKKKQMKFAKVERDSSLDAFGGGTGDYYEEQDNYDFM